MRKASAVIVPVLPSAFDVSASSYSIGSLLHAANSLERAPKLAVVANRVRQNTRVYDSLVRFLDTLTIPFVTTLRNTQYYATAAEKGLSVLELKEPRVHKDKEQWRP